MPTVPTSLDQCVRMCAVAACAGGVRACGGSGACARSAVGYGSVGAGGVVGWRGGGVFHFLQVSELE